MIIKSKPFHYDDIDWSKSLWGDWLIEFAKDIAAVKIFDYIKDKGVVIE